MHILRLTWPSFRVLEKVLPKVVVILFFGKVDSLAKLRQTEVKITTKDHQLVEHHLFAR